jgi:hypothetical protein
VTMSNRSRNKSVARRAVAHAAVGERRFDGA